MSLRELIALEERQFQAQVRRAAPGMLPRLSADPLLRHWDRWPPKPKHPIKDKREDVLDLYSSGKHLKEIALDCDMHRRDVRRMVEQARKRRDPRAARRSPAIRVKQEAFFVRLPALAHRKIREAAESRGLDEEEIVCLLVELITNDKLVDAILDDDT